MFYSLKDDEIIKTRKSSCVNARGIPTAAYQVLHLLSCTGGTLAGVYPRVPPSGPSQGVPHPWPRGYPRVPHGPGQGGTPSQAGGGALGYPTSHLDLAGVPSQLDMAGVPPPPRRGLTNKVKI